MEKENSILMYKYEGGRVDVLISIVWSAMWLSSDSIRDRGLWTVSLAR